MSGMRGDGNANAPVAVVSGFPLPFMVDSQCLGSFCYVQMLSGIVIGCCWLMTDDGC